jgi:hypothetical protein
MAKPVCKIYNHTLAFCSNFVTDPKGRNKQVDEKMEPRGQSPWYLHEIPAYAHSR